MCPNWPWNYHCHSWEWPGTSDPLVCFYLLIAEAAGPLLHQEVQPFMHTEYTLHFLSTPSSWLSSSSPVPSSSSSLSSFPSSSFSSKRELKTYRFTMEVDSKSAAWTVPWVSLTIVWAAYTLFSNLAMEFWVCSTIANRLTSRWEGDLVLYGS